MKRLNTWGFEEDALDSYLTVMNSKKYRPYTRDPFTHALTSPKAVPDKVNHLSSSNPVERTTTAQVEKAENDSYRSLSLRCTGTVISIIDVALVVVMVWTGNISLIFPILLLIAVACGYSFLCSKESKKLYIESRLLTREQARAEVIANNKRRSLPTAAKKSPHPAQLTQREAQKPVSSSPSPEQVRTVSDKEQWTSLVGRLGEVSLKLMAFETDPEKLYFTHSLMRDVLEPATARFYDAYSEAQVIAHDSYDSKHDDVEALDRVVSETERAWEAAWKNAGRKAQQGIVVGGKVLTDEERGHLETARRAIALVLDSSSTPAEATAAWNRAQRILKSLNLSLSEEDTMRLMDNNQLVHRVRKELES